MQRDSDPLMVLWFAALSVLGVFVVFRDGALDYRLIALGALVPDPIDAVLVGRFGPMHSVVVAVAFLMMVMVVTIGRRALRRRALAIPIGIFAHLVLDAAWTSTKGFWWPLAGTSARSALPVVQRGLALGVVFELVGLVATVYAYRRFGLRNPVRRNRFVRTGRLDPAVV